MRRCGCGKIDALLAIAPSEIGVDHTPLDRAGADNGDLDHQIIEFLRFHPRQHVDLRAAFDLEGADAVAAPQHGIGFGVFGGDSL